MAMQLPHSPPNPTVIRAKCLQNRGIVYELSSLQVTCWVSKEKAAFMAGFDRTLVIKDRAVSMIVEYMPVTHSPDALAENRIIECESRLEEGMLLSTRWIKPLQRHIPGQQVAHIVACFCMMEATNHAIRLGIVIAGKCTWVRRM